MTNFSHLEIEQAYKKIKSQILKTPLVTNQDINKLTKANVFFKLENLQWTGSFKLRGAMHKISLLSTEDKQKGVVAYSSGNHAQAVAYASSKYGINSIIIMPKNAPDNKIKNTKKYGAEIILYDPNREKREDIGKRIAKEQGRILIKPYDDLDIIAGQGTCGLEIANELVNLKIIPDTFLCCCGGGGLIAGSSTYLTHVFPKMKCYSVEPEGFNDTQISLKKNSITSNMQGKNSICDALLAEQPGNITFPINQKNLYQGLSVTDDEVKKTILTLSEDLKIVVEPGGAVAASALLNHKIDTSNKTIVVMISGGNIDELLFSNIVKKFK